MTYHNLAILYTVFGCGNVPIRLSLLKCYNVLRDARYALRDTGYGLRVASCRAQVAICRMRVTVCELRVVRGERSFLFIFQEFGFFYFLGEEVYVGRFFDHIHGAELDGLEALFIRDVGRQQNDRQLGL